MIATLCARNVLAKDNLHLVCCQIAAEKQPKAKFKAGFHSAFIMH